jgi:hypothetical protein
VTFAKSSWGHAPLHPIRWSEGPCV